FDPLASVGEGLWSTLPLLKPLRGSRDRLRAPPLSNGVGGVRRRHGHHARPRLRGRGWSRYRAPGPTFADLAWSVESNSLQDIRPATAGPDASDGGARSQRARDTPREWAGTCVAGRDGRTRAGNQAPPWRCAGGADPGCGNGNAPDRPCLARASPGPASCGRDLA